MSEKEINEIVAKNLTNYLEEKNKTQLELAEYLGVSQATVSNWCKGVKMPRMKKIDAICEYLGIKRSELIDEKEKNDNILYSLSPADIALLSKIRRLNTDGLAHLNEELDMMLMMEKFTLSEHEKAGRLLG